jgi:hypothetical protein
MATVQGERVPAWFWIVAGLALLWEAMGCYAYVTQVSMSADQLAAMPEGQRQMWETMPVWVVAAYAVAVWVGLLGAIALLMRRQWARPLFIVSLIAVLIQFGWSFLIAGAAEKIGPSAYGLPAAIIVIGIALVWFSGMAARRGWLK